MWRGWEGIGFLGRWLMIVGGGKEGDIDVVVIGLLCWRGVFGFDGRVECLMEIGLEEEGIVCGFESFLFI